MFSSRMPVAVAFSLVTISSALAHTPAEFLEVLSVKPARLTEHDVELKTAIDPARASTDLVGPRHFARSVGCLGRAAKKNPAYLSWYEIVGDKTSFQRKVSVLDLVRGYENKVLTVGPAEFLLSPAQLITTGSPDEIPDGLDHYKAYRVLDPPAIDREAELTGSLGPGKHNIGKPVFVCIPSRQWHHDEFVEATHPNDCFVVYELDSQEHKSKISTIGQFGLNELQSDKIHWICVRAALLSSDVQ